LTDLAYTVQRIIESILSDINTSTPGVIVSYDAAKNRAIVKPDIPKWLADDDELATPKIVEVPILWPASSGGKTSFTMPLKAGDGVMLMFTQRSLEGWLSGSKEMPDDPRQFDLSDCIAIPGLQSSGISADVDDVVLKFEKSEMRIKKDGTISIKTDQAEIKMTSDGKIDITAQDKASLNGVEVTVKGQTKATIDAPSITLAGNVHILGDLTVDGDHP